MNRGVSAESPSASRRRRTAAFRPCSKSTKVFAGHRRSERFARHELARLLEERLEDLDGLVGDLETGRPLAELPRADVELEDPEPHPPWRRALIVHG